MKDFNKNTKNTLLKLLNTGFAHIFGSSVINKIIVFLSGIILVRIVEKAEFGSYSYTLNIVSIAEIFSSLGLVYGVFQINSEKIGDKEAQDRVYRFGSSIGIWINILISAVLLIISFSINIPIDGVNSLLKIAFLIPLFYVLPEYQFVYLRSRLKTKEYAYSNTINCLLISLFTVIGAFLLGARGAFILRVISYMVTALLVYSFFRAPLYVTPCKITSQEKKDLFSISSISMVNNGLSHLLYLADVFVIGLVLTNEEMVATYKIATTIPTAMSFIPIAIVTYIYPHFASHKGDMKWLRSRYKKIVVYLSAFNFVLVGILFILAPFIVEVVFGPQYLDGIKCFRILLVNYFFSSTFKVMLGNIMVMLRRLKYNLFESILSSAINVIGDYFLIKAISIEGAAYTTLIVTTVASIISFLYFLHITRKNAEGIEM